MHPDFRDQLNDYFERACRNGGQTPHVLAEAFAWHERCRITGSMLATAAQNALILR